jgi:hypothetical protein
VSSPRSGSADELLPDNASRVAIFDAMYAARVEGRDGLTEEELRERVLPRLRVLVPRELHLKGEAAYVSEKIKICLEAQPPLLLHSGEDGGLLTLSDYPPRVRYPNNEIHDYVPGLEQARERLEADNSRLREAHFDVRDHVASSAKDAERFEALVQSMREHGYLKHFPLVELPDGSVLDGRARQDAAAIVGLEVERYNWPSTDERDLTRRRDTPLARVLLVLNQNATRLHAEDRAAVYAEVARVAGRSWNDIQTDLSVTHDWRNAAPRKYIPTFAARVLKFRADGEPRIHVSKVDDKVQVRSLLQAAGLPASYRVPWLKDYVPLERAHSDQPNGGASPGWAPADVLLEGIEAMLKDRRARKNALIDPEWTDVTDWLRTTFSLNEAS